MLKKCSICGESIYSFENVIKAKIDGHEYIIHNRPGCRDVWEDIKHSPDKCFICGRKTDNLVYIPPSYYIVCKNECEESLRENEERN